MPVRLVLLDNTVLTNFALIERPDLVLGLWGESAATTPVVMEEFQAGVHRRELAGNAWQALSLVRLSPAEEAFAETMSAALGAGGVTRALAHQGRDTMDGARGTAPSCPYGWLWPPIMTPSTRKVGEPMAPPKGRKMRSLATAPTFFNSLSSGMAMVTSLTG